MQGTQQIFNSLIEFFEEDEWDFEWVQGTSALKLDFQGKQGKWRCVAQAIEKFQQIVFYSVCPVDVPEERRAAMAEFITRANYGLIIGCFEMDYEDGEVRFRTSIDLEGTEVSMPLVRQVVYPNVIIFDRYFPGLMRLIYGERTAADLIREIESNTTVFDDEPQGDDLTPPEDDIDEDYEDDIDWDNDDDSDPFSYLDEDYDTDMDWDDDDDDDDDERYDGSFGVN